MSILEFVEMSIPECIICCALAFAICLTYSGIGYIFSGKQGILVQSVIGMTFVGAIVTVCAGIAAGMSKYVILLGGGCGLAVNIYRIVKKNISRRDLIALIPVGILFLIFVIHIFIWVVPRDGVFHYNCHLTYFSGVPLELTQADYFSRIRLMDVYPYEWSKYHFFNGAYTAIPLMFFFKKNFVSYLFAKTLTVSFYAGAIFEILKDKYEIKKAVVHFLVGIIMFWTIAYNGFNWSLETNNYSCLFMMLIAWMLFEKKDYSTATMFSIGYAITKSGSIISGACLFVLGLVKMFIEDGVCVASFLKKEYKAAVFSIIVGIGVLSTAFVGTDAAGVSSISFGSIDALISAIFNRGWLYLLPLGGYITERGPLFALHLEFLILAVFLYLLIRNRKVLKMYVARFRIAAIIIAILSVCSLREIIRRMGQTQARFVLFAFFLFYVLPILLTFISAKKDMRTTYAVFVLSALVPFAFFDGGVSFPNYSIATFVLLVVFSEQFTEDMINVGSKGTGILACIVTLGLIYVCGNDFQTVLFQEPEDRYHQILMLDVVDYSDEPFEYYSEDDADLAKLNALKGNHVHYNIMPTRSDETMKNTSMAMSFLPAGYDSELK